MFRSNSTPHKALQRFFFVVMAFVLAVTWFVPMMSARASAAQLTIRSLTLGSAQPSVSTSYTFAFRIGASSTSKIQSLKFQACTVAVGTCGTVTGLSFSSAAQTGQTGFQGGTAFAADASVAGDCIASATVLCAKRSDATVQTASTDKTITFSTITNPSAPNTAFFVRMTTYSAVTSQYNASDIIDTGTVAAAIAQTLTVSANVAEILNFCVGSTTVDTGTTSTPSDCLGVSGASVNIGTLDPSVTNVSPVSTNGGDGNNGIAMLRTNAATGANVYYRAVPAGSGTNHLGTLRLTGASCNAGSVNTDGCIDAQGTSKAVFNAGTEKFGMTVAAVNCTSTTSYTCTYAGGTYNLVRQSNYDPMAGNTYTTDSGTVAGASNGQYAFDETSGASPVLLASSTSSTIKQVDDEALILKFAASNAITTPFGSYSVAIDYIAVPAF